MLSYNDMGEKIASVRGTSEYINSWRVVIKWSSLFPNYITQMLAGPTWLWDKAGQGIGEGQSEDSSKETFSRGKAGIPNRSPAKKRPLACQKQGKSEGNLPEVGRCCCAHICEHIYMLCSHIFRNVAIRRSMVPLPYGDFSHQSSVWHGVEEKEMGFGEICHRSSLEMLFSPCLVLQGCAQTQVLLSILPCVTLSLTLGHSSARQI